MELIQKEMTRNRQGRAVSDQFLIDEDYTLPDEVAGVRKVLAADARLKPEEVRRVENYVRIKGTISFHVLYAADEGEGRLFKLDGTMPFEEMVYVDQPEESGDYQVTELRSDLTVSVIHARKLNLKMTAEVTVGSEELLREQVPVDVKRIEGTTEGSIGEPENRGAEGADGLYRKQRQVQLLKVHTRKRDTHRIKEELTIPGTKENMGTLLWTDITSRKADTRLKPDGMIVSGELLVFCFYESAEGRLDWLEEVVPYEGKIDCPGADETMYHHASVQLSDAGAEVRMDKDGEMRILGIEGTLEVQMTVYEEETAELLEDLYSLKEECKLTKKELEYDEMVMQNHSKCKMKEVLSLPELGDDILQICHSSGTVQLDYIGMETGGIRLEGMLHLRFLYIKSNDGIPFDTWQGMVPFSYLAESNETGADVRMDISSAVEQLHVSLLGGGNIEVKAVLAFHSFCSRMKTVPVVEAVEVEPLSLEELEKQPGIVGYLVREGDDLFTLAKMYHTTKERICKVNELEKKELKPGDKILIFKENMGIL